MIKKQLCGLTLSAMLIFSSVPSVAAQESQTTQPLIGISGPKKRARSATVLTGNTKKLYNEILKGMKKIANGQTNSTKIKLNLKQIGLSKKMTKKQLGVSSFTDKKGNVTPTTQKKMFSHLGVNFLKAFDQIYLEDPFDTYWFDYYSGNYPFDASYKYSLYAKIQGNTIRLTSHSGYMMLDLPVAKEYGSNYKISAKARARANNAINNIHRIVSENANVSDYNKLVNYRNEICDLVTYDDQAMKAGQTNHHSDPWNLISVFDGDPKTNVVCEGYSKAFAYLCDLTKWQNPAIKAYTVTGYVELSTNTSSRVAHMWNLVHMPDKRNYLVDLTNSDDVAGTNNDLLFMVGVDQPSNNAYAHTLSLNGDTMTINYDYDPQCKQVFTSSERYVGHGDYTNNEALTLITTPVYNTGVITTKPTFEKTGIRTQTAQLDGSQITSAEPKLTLGKASLSSLVNVPKGKLMVKWAKVTNASKYQVAYKVKGGKWKYTTSSVTNKNLYRLKKKKYYSVKVRAQYGKYSGNWSAVKSITIKK